MFHRVGRIIEDECGKGLAQCLAHSRCSMKGHLTSYTAGGNAKIMQPLWKPVW